MDLQTPDEPTMVRTVVGSLSDKFQTVDADTIRSVVEAEVREWCARARIKTFVGIIAERHARHELELIAH